MHKRFAKQLEQARRADGGYDFELLGGLVARSYAEAEKDRKRIRTQNARFTAALENMAHGLSMYDARARLVTCNQMFLDIYGLPRSLGRPGTSFRRVLEGRVAADSYYGDDPAEYLQTRLDHVGSTEQVFTTNVLNNGKVIWVSHQPMADGGWVSTHKDVTELFRAQQDLQHLAYHDALTNLPNRSLMHQSVQQRFDSGDEFSALCIDLDGFKAVNDTLGHASGDRLLQDVARRLEIAADGDRVGRMGGDEFAILHPSADIGSAMALARRVQDMVRRPFDLDGNVVAIAASIGIALAPQDGASPDQLLKSGDLALYAAKKDGRGGFRFFEPAMDRAVRDRRQMERDLRRALELGEFELHYQPILNLRSQTLVGFEALLRWRHPTNGMVSPTDFIPVAEELGLIVPIGEWVIREALTEASRWPAALHIAVNVSSVQFKRGNLVGVIMNALASTGIAHDRVEIEITESLFLENDRGNLEILRQLHGLGLKVAMDDFGTGYSALSYLLRFPFDKIKIDGSFVRALDNAEAAHTIVRSVADIGNRMGMTVTAEGVETAEQLRNVHALGYTEAQGYLISRPMPRDAVHRLLTEAHDQMPAAPLESRLG